MADITLTAARPEDPASIVAAVGAADLIEERTGQSPTIRWELHEHGGHRPVIGRHDLDVDAFAELVATDAPINRSALPGEGKGQSLAKLAAAAHPNKPVGQAYGLEHDRLLAEGCTNEARLLVGCVQLARIAAGPPRQDRTPMKVILVRSTLASGAKSDVAQACKRRPVAAADIAAELRADDWAWHTSPAGDWGLCSALNHDIGWRLRNTNKPIASATLARLLTRGIMASYANGQTSQMRWPIWTTPLPLRMAVGWQGWYRGGIDLDPDLGMGLYYSLARGAGIISWYGAIRKPLNKVISVWARGAAMSDHDIRRYAEQP